MKLSLKCACIAVAVFCAAMPAYSRNEEAYNAVKEIVASIKTPMSMGVNGEVERITVDDQYLTYWVLVNQDLADLDNARGMRGQMKAGMLVQFTSPGSALGALGRLLVEAGLGMRFKAEGDLDGTGYEVSLSTDELEKLMSDPSAASPRECIEGLTAVARASLPMSIGNGLRMVDLRVSDEMIEYVTEVDDTMMDFNALKSSVAQMKELILKSISTSADPGASLIAGYCVKGNMKMVYTYRSSGSGELCVVTLLLEDLARNLPEDIRTTLCI